MSKLVLKDDKVKDAIIEAITGREGEQHWSKPTGWPNGINSDVVYAAANSEHIPPVLVEKRYTVDNGFLYRRVRYCEEIFGEYGVSPVVLVIAIQECRSPVLNKASKNKSNPFFFKLPCYPWAQQCYILSKESISFHMNKSPLNPIVALGSFFIEQKQSVAEHAHQQHDPFIQHLYTKATDIFRNHAVEESMTDTLVRAVDSAESRYDRAIDMLENDVKDPNAKKRTTDCLKEGVAMLRACKRQFAPSQPSSPASSSSQLQVSSSSQLQASSSSQLHASSSEPPPPANISTTTDNYTDNWRYIEDYMEKIGSDRMNWQVCYNLGQSEGYFKTYSTHVSLKNAYNRYKKK